MRTILLVLLSIFMISCGSDSGSDTGSGSTTNLAKAGTYPYEWGEILYGYEIQFTVKEASEHSVDVGFQVIYAFNNSGSVVGHNTDTGVNYSPESYDYTKNTDNNITIHLSYNSGNSNEYYTLIPTSATTGSYTYEANNYGNTAWARGTYVILVDGGGYDGGTLLTPLPNGSWDTPILINENETSTSPYNAKLATDDNGNSIQVYEDFVEHNVYTNVYSTASGWEKTTKLNSDLTQAIRPQILINDNGNAFTFWSEADKDLISDINYSVKLKAYNTMSGWAKTETLTSPIDHLYVIDAAMDSNGNAVILMLQSTSTLYSNLYIKKYSLISGWETGITEIRSNVYRVSLTTKIVISENGDIMIGVMDHDTASGLLHYTNDTDTWEYLRITTFNNFDIAGDNMGNFMMIWNGITATIQDLSLLTMKYTVGNGLDSSPSIIVADTQVESTKIVIDTNGNAIAVWQDTYNYLIWPSWHQLFSIKSSYYSAGIGWSTAEYIDNDSIESKTKPQIAFDKQNNAVAVWHGDNHIYANHYIEGQGWSGERRIADNLTTDARDNFSYVDLVVDNNGNAIVVYIEPAYDSATDSWFYNYLSVIFK